MRRTFASDNNSGIHPDVLRAIEKANQGHVVAYGDDEFTERATAKFKEVFGKNVEVFFVFNGTGANVLSLRAMTDSFNSIICSKWAHIHVDECGAPEKFTGCKLIPIETKDGKLTPELIGDSLNGLGDQHHVQAKVISITQATEVGTVYSREDLTKLSHFAREKGLYLHMDGARLSNAAASTGLSLKNLTADCGVDAVSFGGTKNGLMGAEAVLLFNSELVKNFKFLRKQGMQLSSKMRFISVQLEALLANDLWLLNAKAANEKAQLLSSELKNIPEIEVTQMTQANGVFARFPRSAVSKLLEHTFFYTWAGHDSEFPEIRLMCSFDTTTEDVINFVRLIKETI